ncbi:MAG: cupin domain-containing protein [Dehalococcoidia bacterium]|nr:cupin domain-containing protein [Dehalococcoidia bacterium]
MDKLGEKIKQARKEKGLTLAEVGKIVKCSPSFISGIERGKVSPSIATLKRIAAALETHIVDFFVAPGVPAEPVVMKEKDRTQISMSRWKAEVNLLVRSTTGKRMSPFYTVIQPGGGAPGKYSHEGEEFGIVLKGDLEITLNDTIYRVKEGESFYYSSMLPHSWINPTQKETIVVWVVSPPSW